MAKAKYIERIRLNQEECRKAKEEYEVEEKKINDKIDMRQAQIERLRRKRNKLEDNYNKTKPEEIWIANALMEELEEKLGLVGEIYGPFGLRCETTIYLAEPSEKASHGDIAITSVPTYSLTLTPDDSVESGYRYETGKQLETYPEGSIGWLNGFGREELPLPSDIDEIVKLLNYNEKQ